MSEETKPRHPEENDPEEFERIPETGPSEAASEPQTLEATSEPPEEPVTPRERLEAIGLDVEPEDLVEPERYLDRYFADGKLVGKSGTVYTPINLLTEFNTPVKNYIRKLIEPARPLIVLLLTKLDGGLRETTQSDGKIDDDELKEILRTISIEELFIALAENDADQKLLAVLFLPEPSDGRLRIPRIDEAAISRRCEDLEELTYYAKLQAFKLFFTTSLSFSRASFGGFMRQVLTPRTTNSAS